jgi:adenine C2-methylase RlmN of 23S rRNA A2503 and tRNA A37
MTKFIDTVCNFAKTQINNSSRILTKGEITKQRKNAYGDYNGNVGVRSIVIEL